MHEPVGDAVIDVQPSSAPSVAPAWTHALAAEPEDEPLPEPGENERWDDELPVTAITTEDPQSLPNDTPPMDAPVPEATEPDIAAVSTPLVAPTASSRPVSPRPAAKPRTRSGTRTPRRLPPALTSIEPAETAAVEAPVPSPARVVEATPDLPPPEGAVAVPGWALRADSPATPSWPLAPQPPAPEPLAPEPLVPGWPPLGDPGDIAEAQPRIPAGSYLPPSAVLPSGEALASAATGRAAETIGRAHVHPTTVDRSPNPSPEPRLSQLGLPTDAPRRVVGIGAGIAALGFLLPWAGVLAGSGLLGGYLTQWGLAGPGHWIVGLLLVGLAIVSLAGGRMASMPVGLPAVAVATLLTGLAWPYLFGFLGREVGIWVVMFGAILLVSGGLLDLRAGRHAAPDSTV